MKKLSLLMFSVLCCLTAFAFDGNVLCTKAENVSDQWTGILPGRPPFIPSCQQVVKKEPFDIRVFFSNPSIKDGMVKVGAKLAIVDPSGKVIYEKKLKNQEFKCQNSKSVFLFSDYIGMSFDPPDKFGKYTYNVELQDLNSGKAAKTMTSIELKDKTSLKVSDNLQKAITDFYHKPDAQNIIPSFLWFVDQIPDMKKKQKRNFNPLSMAAAYYFMLRRNPQLHAEFAKTVNGLKGSDALKCGVIIQHELGPKAFELLSEKNRGLWDNRMAGIFNIKEPQAPWQLDVLWSEFLITGKKAPLVKIVNAIGKMDNNLSIESYKAKKQPSKEDRASLMRYLTGMSALWSVGSNAKQHRLAGFYLEGMLCRNEIKDPATAAKIAKILSEIPQFKDTIKVSVTEK